MKSAKIAEYFNESQGFEALPAAYQERIINFFSEDRHYMVDVSDVRVCLDSGQNFTAFEVFEDLAEYSRNNTIKGVMACKKCNWPSMEAFTEWGELVFGLGEEDMLLLLLTHVIQHNSEVSEEWYIASI